MSATHEVGAEWALLLVRIVTAFRVQQRTLLPGVLLSCVLPGHALFLVVADLQRAGK